MEVGLRRVPVRSFGPRQKLTSSLSSRNRPHTTTMAENVSTLLNALKHDQVIPDVIPKSFAPSVLFSIVYPGVETGLGKEILRNHTLPEPTIKLLSGAGEGAGDKSFTLVLTDPDAPSRADPKFGEWRHWVVTGVKLSEANENVKLTSAAATPYEPPAPPAGTGLHRYVFLLFEEPVSFSIPKGAIEHVAALKDRRSWNAQAFAEKYGLKLVGANFFVTQSQV